MRRLLLSVIFTLSLALPVIASDAGKSSETSRPDWCRSGYICVPTSEMADDAEYHLQLREQVLRYKRRAARFGLTVGPGIGVGSVITNGYNSYDVHWVGTTGVFVVWGLRF